MNSMLRYAARALAPAALLAGAVACNDVVDLAETPQTFLSPETFFNSDANVAVALNGVYAPLSNTWGWNTEYATWCDDNEMSCWNWMGGGFRGLLNSSAEGSATYVADYQVVGRANTILAAVRFMGGEEAKPWWAYTAERKRELDARRREADRE